MSPVRGAERKAVEPIEQQLALIARARGRLEVSGLVTRYVVTTSVRRRAGPAVTHDVVETLPAGEHVCFTEEVDGWIGGVVPGDAGVKAGWIDARFVVRDPGEID